MQLEYLVSKLYHCVRLVIKTADHAEHVILMPGAIYR